MMKAAPVNIEQRKRAKEALKARERESGLIVNTIPRSRSRRALTDLQNASTSITSLRRQTKWHIDYGQSS